MPINSYAFGPVILKYYLRFRKEKKGLGLCAQIINRGSADRAGAEEGGSLGKKFMNNLQTTNKEAWETGYRLCLLKEPGIVEKSLQIHFLKSRTTNLNSSNRRNS